jgi:pyruvate/2-oxoglutarate dehydrogenase complex dihydrolipoamide dehydrogenase (E3) component
MIVIGAGSGGLSMGLGLHELGFKILLIDKSDESIGGECLNNGCVPSKAFIHASKLVHSALKAQQFGPRLEGQVSLSKVWQYVTKTQDKIRAHENASFLQDQGLDVVLGTAKFIAKNQVAVNDDVFSAKKITIATGSKPRPIEVPGAEVTTYYNNENIWSIAELPAKMLFIGAGPVNMELGQAFSRLGSKVTMVEMADRILIKEAPEISEILHQQSTALGIKIHTESQLVSFIDAHTAIVQTSNAKVEIEFDAVVIGIGRVFDFSSLDLHKAGIKMNDQGGIIIDSYNRTTNKNVLVIGDATGGPQFSHAAELQATIMIQNQILPFKRRVTYNKFSWVTFTDPEVATFGLSESQLIRQGTIFEKLILDFEEDDRAVTSDYTYGKLILYVTRRKLPFSSAKLLGGTMIAPAAGEMIQELILAQSAGLGISSIFNKIYPYPTGSRVNKTVVLNKYAQSIRPWMKRIIKLLY